jgi:hypothetical protein
VDATGQLLREDGVNEALTLKAGLAAERGSDNLDGKVGFAIGVMPCMSDVAMRLINDDETLWRERRRQLFPQCLSNGHRRSFRSPHAHQEVGGNAFRVNGCGASGAAGRQTAWRRLRLASLPATTHTLARAMKE